jgi:hypothetical protein
MMTSIYLFCFVFAALLAVSMAREEAETLEEGIESDELAANKRGIRKSSKTESQDISSSHDISMTREYISREIVI